MAKGKGGKTSIPKTVPLASSTKPPVFKGKGKKK